MSTKTDHIELADLSFACFLYTLQSSFDKDINTFRQYIKKSFDHNNDDHYLYLVEWLRKWGCRQFSKKHTKLSIRSINIWYLKWNKIISKLPASIYNFEETDFEIVSDAFNDISKSVASKRGGKGIKIGPTGASKILYALFPARFPPWDIPIRKKLQLSGDGDGYIILLKKFANSLISLEPQCKMHNFELSDLPTIIDRPESSLVKLLDEYYWITITRNFRLPTCQHYTRWLNWKCAKASPNIA